MLRNLFANVAVIASLGLLVLPAGVSAQSAITGAVKDATGAVLPGVTIEVASPALIERVRTAVSDAQGRYAIVDLRPGAYTVTFTVQGFNTFVQSGLDLPSNFTATVNADMKLGALAESVTVTGAGRESERRFHAGAAPGGPPGAPAARLEPDQILGSLARHR
jgi:hypothetical protein